MLTKQRILNRSFSVNVSLAVTLIPLHFSLYMQELKHIPLPSTLHMAELSNFTLKNEIDVGDKIVLDTGNRPHTFASIFPILLLMRILAAKPRPPLYVWELGVICFQFSVLLLRAVVSA
ncbi:hypothetical protein BJV82DRAFT_626953 [Fennellomyces sp. T-0311]|nr:hypothetical protein BJV82DRAFT_626953 [Fennellomyces sp. T-0311]